MGEIIESSLPLPWVTTPLIESRALSEAAQCRIFLKLDTLQPAGSFKSRGVGNFVRQRVLERRRESGRCSDIHFYAASGGNAGIAAVHAAKSLGYPATVVVPRTAKPVMVARIWAIGATNVIQYGNTIAEAASYVQSTLLRDDPAGIYVPPFDHQDIWDGNASIMDEISSQLPGGGNADVMLCSVGGGGLLNGIMQYIDEHQHDHDLQHKTHVIATETMGAESLSQSLDAGKVITLPKITSAATSLGVVRVSEKTFEYAQRSNVHSVVITDEEAAKGCCLLAEHDRLMTELTVGVNVPVCYDGMLQSLLGDRKKLSQDSRVVIVCCGGNDISIDMLVAWRQAMLEKEAAKVAEQDAAMRPESATKMAGVAA